MKIKLSELRHLVKSAINEQNWAEKMFGKMPSGEPDPKRVQYFDNLTNQISSKLLGKKILFGKIGVFDNASIIIEKYADRNHAVNLKDEQVENFSIMFYVRRVEEDLYPNEKPGTRVWRGLVDITVNYNESGGFGTLEVTLFPGKGEDIKFDTRINATANLTLDQLGGKSLWLSATKFNSYQ